jgi:hypothetical protein
MESLGTSTKYLSSREPAIRYLSASSSLYLLPHLSPSWAFTQFHSQHSQNAEGGSRLHEISEQ